MKTGWMLIFKSVLLILGFLFFELLCSHLAVAQQPPPYLATSYSGGDIMVSKDDEKFREDWQLKDDSFTGGLEYLLLRHPFDKEWLLKADIKTLPGQRDHSLLLEITKKNLFYTRLKYERFPHWYDDTGGVFKDFNTPFFELGVGPSTDRENFLLELGLILPDLPVITFSYEKRRRDGEISSLTWGEAREGDIRRKIVPTEKEVDDDADIFKIGVKHKNKIANVEAEQRWEFTEVDTVRRENNFINGQLSESVIDKKHFSYDSSQTSVKIDKAVSKKLHLFFGYMFNSIDTDSTILLRTLDPTGAIIAGGFRRNWFNSNSDNDVNYHLWNFNILSRPLKDLAVQGHLKLKSVHRDSIASFNNDTTAPFDKSPDEMNNITARWNDTILGEGIRVTYKRVPWLSPYFEAEWQQGDVEIKEKDLGTEFFIRDTDADFDKQVYAVGLNFAPFRRFNGSLQYRKEITDNNYDDNIDTTDGYSAFIDEQDIDADVFTVRLSAHPISSVSTTFRYEFRLQDVHSEKDNFDTFILRREKASIDIQTFSGSITFTPFSNLYLMSMAMYQDFRTKTGAREVSVAPVRAYDADSLTLVNSVLFALNKKTDLTLDYQVSFTNNFDNINTIGLPLEHDYTLQRLGLGVKYKCKENITLWGKYGFYDYNESHIDNVDNYVGHFLASGVEIRWR